MFVNCTAGAVVVFADKLKMPFLAYLRIISCNFLQYRKNQTIMQIILLLFM